jgi:hypothetical protein
MLKATGQYDAMAEKSRQQEEERQQRVADGDKRSNRW